MAGNISGYVAYRPSVSPHFSQRLSQQQSDALRQLAERNAALSTQSVSIPNAVRELSADDPALNFTDKLLKNQLTEQFINSPLSITTTPTHSLELKAEDVALNYISQHYQKGLSEGKTSNELNKLIDHSAQHYRNAYRNTRSILDKLGRLGPEQQSFISRSEHRVELALNNMHNLPVGGGFEQPASKPFELTIETQEGDRVTITFSIEHTQEEGGMEYASANSQYNSFDSFQLSYQVEGELSDEEHSAMMEIFAGVGQLADEYFSLPQANQNKTLLSNDLLTNFNSEQLAGVDLSMATGDEHQFSYRYSFDKEEEKQKLAVNMSSYFTQPVSFDITTSIWGGQDSEQLAQYFDAIEKNADAHLSNLHKDERESLDRSIDGYKTALGSMLGLSARHTQIIKQADENFMGGQELVTNLTNQLIREDERYQQLATTKDASLKEGISGLADFKTSFKYGVNKRDAGQSAYFKFTQKQETTVTSDDDFMGVKQKKSHQSSASSARNNVLTTEQSENYTVKAAIEGRQVVALDQEASIANRSEQKSVEAGLTTKETVDTRDSASSSLRLIEGIWTQKLADKSEREDDYGVFDDGKVLFNLHKVTQDAHQKMVIIGTQNKNDSGEFLRKKYNPQLAKVNLFMGSV